MAVRFGVVSALLGSSLLVAACDEPETKGQPLFPTVTAGTGPMAPTCKVGEPCRCDSGFTGQTECANQVKSCACSMCESTFTAPSSEPATFVACGGDPSGTWRLKAVDYAALGVTLPGTAVTCPADVNEKAPARMLLQLLPEGNGDVFLGGLSNSSIVLESCLAETGLGTSCASFRGCLPIGTCGLCACGEEGVPFGFFPYGFVWQLVGNTLALGGNGGAPGGLGSYQYCVNGNQLTLAQPNSQMLYQLERAELTGTPQACAARSPETCVVPTNPTNPALHAESEDDACHFACTGGPNCAAATYDTACRDAGCTWDVTQCAGEPARECLFGDYDALPGCVAMPVAAP